MVRGPRSGASGTRVAAAFVGAALLLGGCQTIPYNEDAVNAVSEYAVAADRHIVAVGTAWTKCYAAYDGEAKKRETRLVIAKDVGTAIVLATDTDDTGLTSREAVRRGLLKVIGNGQIDALQRVDEPFRGYMSSLIGDADLEPLLRDLVAQLTAPPDPGQTEEQRREAVAAKSVAYLFAAEADRAKCTGAAFANFEDKFYDDWSSRLFAVQQVAKADDALGLCSKVGGLVQEYAGKVADEAMKTGLSRLRFGNGTECSMATVGGVLQQHENLRRAHQDLIVLNREEGQLWRETLAQSVRIAVTVENFKKSAAADSGM